MSGPPAPGTNGPSASTLDLVLDASVAVKWYVPEGHAPEARRFMVPRFAMHVPSFFAAECGNTIWKKSGQRRELDRDRGREIFDEILAYPKRIHDAEILTALAYDLAHGVGNVKLAIYDFIYLALAVALDCRLVTADRAFYTALEASPHGLRLLWVADPIPD
jgi:predicted nucleic acid-binding protein